MMLIAVPSSSENAAPRAAAITGWDMRAEGKYAQSMPVEKTFCNAEGRTRTGKWNRRRIRSTRRHTRTLARTYFVNFNSLSIDRPHINKSTDDLMEKQKSVRSGDSLKEQKKKDTFELDVEHVQAHVEMLKLRGA